MADTTSNTPAAASPATTADTASAFTNGTTPVAAYTGIPAEANAAALNDVESAAGQPFSGDTAKTPQNVAGDTKDLSDVATLALAKPAAGQTEIIEVQPGQMLQAQFDPDQADLSLQGTDLVMSFADGSKIVLDNFAADTQHMPTIALQNGALVAGGIIIAQLQGTQDDIFNLETAAGQAAVVRNDGQSAYSDDLGAITNLLNKLPPIPFTALSFNTPPDTQFDDTILVRAAGPFDPANGSLVPSFETFTNIFDGESSGQSFGGVFEDWEPMKHMGNLQEELSAFNFSFTPSDNEVVNSITISNIPAGVTFFYGTTGNYVPLTIVNGSITLSAQDLANGNLFIKAPAFSDVDIPLTIVTNITDPDSGDTVDLTQGMTVIVDAVADIPTNIQFDGTYSNGVVSMNGIVQFNDIDGSETHQVVIVGVPSQWTLDPASMVGYTYSTVDLGDGTQVITITSWPDASNGQPVDIFKNSGIQFDTNGWTPSGNFANMTIYGVVNETQLDGELNLSNNTSTNGLGFVIGYNDTAQGTLTTDATTDLGNGTIVQGGYEDWQPYQNVGDHTVYPTEINLGFTPADNEVVTGYTISGIPSGVNMFIGTPGNLTPLVITNGTVTIDPADLANGLHVYIQDPSNSGVDIPLTVDATVFDPDTNDTAIISQPLNVTIDAVADMPGLSGLIVGQTSGNSSLFSFISTITFGSDMDGSETHTFVVENVPSEWVFVGFLGGIQGMINMPTAVPQPDGTVDYVFTVSSQSFTGNFLFNLQNWDASQNQTQLTITAIATEANGLDGELNLPNNVAVATDTFTVGALLVETAGGVVTADASTDLGNGVVVPGGFEDWQPLQNIGDHTVYPTEINLGFTPADNEVVNTYTISNIPNGVVLYIGTPGNLTVLTQTNHTVTVSQADLANGMNVYIQDPTNSGVDIPLTVNANITDPDSGATNTVSQSLTVTMDAVADLPAITNVIVGQTSGNSNLFSFIAAFNFGDMDGSETHTFTIENVPAQWTFTGFLGGTTGLINMPTAIPQGDGTVDYVFTVSSANFSGNFLFNLQGWNADQNATQLTITAAADETNVDGELNLANNHAAVTQTFTVGNGGDDTPTIQVVLPNPDVAPTVVSESDVASYGVDQMSGTIQVDFFDDSMGSIQLTANGLQALQLTANGQFLGYVLSPDGQSLTAVDSNGDVVFTVTLGTPQVNSDGTASVTYTVTLFEPLDHPLGDNQLEIPVIVQATDGDGDSVSATLPITVIDHVPIANPDSNNVVLAKDPDKGTVADPLPSGTPAIQVPLVGEVHGNILANDAMSLDAPNDLTSIAFGNNVEWFTNPDGVDANGPYIVIQGQYGTLQLYADGEYTYTYTGGYGSGTTPGSFDSSMPSNQTDTPNNPGTYEDVFTYVITDADGDSSTSTLTITLGLPPKPGAPGDAGGTPSVNGGVIQNDTQGGTGGNTIQSIQSVHDTVPTPDPTAKVMLGGADAQGAFAASDAQGTTTTLTSNGEEVHIALVDGSYVGTTASGHTVFTLSTTTNGAYSFTLNAPVDQSQHGKPVDLGFTYTTQDSHGDVTEHQLHVSVQNDAIYSYEGVGGATGNTLHITAETSTYGSTGLQLHDDGGSASGQVGGLVSGHVDTLTFDAANAKLDVSNLLTDSHYLPGVSQVDDFVKIDHTTGQVFVDHEGAGNFNAGNVVGTLNGINSLDAVNVVLNDDEGARVVHTV